MSQASSIVDSVLSQLEGADNIGQSTFDIEDALVSLRQGWIADHRCVWSAFNYPAILQFFIILDRVCRRDCTTEFRK